ncbi:condensation domain-containing protein, partial [Priestia aryabhattai]|uniref:condensation domain-containing protein n=1 Tax=Priestia aryabhattai TaxID=412384 RepID=UPI001CFCD94D
AVVQLDVLPLTPNGKIDRKALPEPNYEREGSTYVAPRNDLEKKMVDIWEDILGVTPIGVHDNFFELGGDSIKSIQISARLAKDDLKLDVKDIFMYPTIEQLEGCIEMTVVQGEQGLVVGDLTLTPIQRWFFDNEFTDSHHWNQSMMIHSKKGFEERLVKDVFTELIKHHDALRAVYPIQNQQVRPYHKGLDDDLFTYKVYDLTNVEDVQAEINQLANKLQKNINLAEGPLVKVGLFKTNTGDHLLIIIHHLVV